ncbi:MAG: hypothetical protein LLF89_09725 [Spirochaetaceae bacterium]|nr:hypothetical protein [Spirochaetaceae bacterium]
MLRGRNASAVFYEKEIDVENALRYIKAKDSSIERYSLFALIMAAAVRTLALRPALNRFVHGRALYQRNHIAFSFIVKQQMSEEAPEVNAKVFFKPGDGLAEVTRKVNEAIAYAREHGEGKGELIVRYVHAIPGGKAVLMALYRFLDRINLAPPSLIDTDPLFASCYFANLGSIGLDAPFHHLYEWGNVSIFIVLGKLEQKEGRLGPAGLKHHSMCMKLTIDERISEGLYFARAASLFARFIAHPDLLEMPLEDVQARLIGSV